MEGDVRLVPLNGTSSATATCDTVHMGGVELFRQGRWGRICTSGAFNRLDLDEDHGMHTLVASVVCRQLGYSFGTLMNSAAVNDIDLDSYQNGTDGDEALVWATEVRIRPCHHVHCMKCVTSCLTALGRTMWWSTRKRVLEQTICIRRHEKSISQLW